MLLLTRLEGETIRDVLEMAVNESLDSEYFTEALVIIQALLQQDDHKHMKELLDHE